MKYPFLHERKPTFRALIFHQSNLNLRYSTIIGDIQQFLNNGVFYASLMKDGCLF